MANDKEVSLTINLKGKDSAGNAFGQTRRGLASISQQLDQARTLFIQFQSAAVALRGLRELNQLAESIQGVNARLRQAVGGAREFAQAQQFALGVAARTGAGFEAVATLYTRLSAAASGLGVSQQAVAATTEATALALRASGTGAAEAASVVRQFSQALGSGALRGDEFNSIMENGPRLAKALADGLGVPIGRLRELAEQGLLTTDVLTRALESQRQVLSDEVAALPKTISQSLSEVRDSFGLLIDKINSSTGATATVAGAFSALARHIDDVMGAALVAATAAFGAFAARGILALRNLAAQASLTAAATRGATAALGLVGGPLGLITTLLTAGITAWQVWGGSAKKAGQDASDALAEAEASLARMTQQQRFGTDELAKFRRAVAQARDEVDAALRPGDADPFGGAGQIDTARLDAALARLERAKTVLAQAERLAQSVPAAQSGVTALGAEVLRKGFDKFAAGFQAKIDPLGAALRDLRVQAEKAAIPLDSPAFRNAEATIRRAFAPKASSRLPELGREFDAELALTKSALEEQARVIEIALAARLVSESDFFAAKRAIDSAQFDADRARLAQEAAQQQSLIDRLSATAPRDAGQSAEIASRVAQARARLGELNAQLTALDGRRITADFELNVRADKARQDVADAVQAARLELARLTGEETPEQRRQAIQIGFRDLLGRLAGDAESAAIVNRLIDVQAAGANLQALEAQFRASTDRLRTAQDAIGIEQQAGLLTEQQAREQIVRLQQQSVSEMERLLPLMQAAAVAIGPDAVARVAAMKNEFGRLRLATQSVAVEINGKVQDSLATMFEQIATGSASAKDAFASFAKSVLASIAKIASQKLAQSLLGSLGGGSGGGIGGLISGFFGGAAVKAAGGGLITGPGTSTSDSIPARLSSGEYVVRAAAVQRFGVQFLDAVNGLRAAPGRAFGRIAFADGGLVPAAVQPSAGQAVRIVNVIDPSLAADFLESSAGERTVLNVLRRNSGAVRQIFA